MDKNCAGWRTKSLHTGLVILRVLMGFAMASHGYQKVFGGQVNMLAEGLVQWGWPMPTALAWMAALAEFAGGICIALGLGTRVAAFFVFFTMCVAFFKAHGADPFHMKLAPYLYGITALSLIFTGGGRFSLDALFCCRKKDENAA